MLFPTLDYILFLPLVIILFWSVPWKWRLTTLGIASLIFYGSWNLSYVPLLVGISLLAWMLSHFVYQKTVNRWAMGFSVFLLFVPLIIFKYSDWLIWNLNQVGSWFGLNQEIPALGLALPVGISFFTFQAAAYLIDVRREGKPSKNIWSFFTFLSFFPQLVAGPIVRRNELLPQLEKLRLLQSDEVSEGIFRIIKGMAKKLIIADTIALVLVNPVFASPGDYTSLELWLVLYAYTLQIYYDFSAYTDIAIGSALLFGIRLPENFRRPYQATSVAEFWRRWHITLSNWVRDYIYYPLGGSRADSEWKVYRNIIITMVVIGLWHGASWNFVIYGMLHGSAVSINRWTRKKHGRRPGDPLPSRFAWLWRFLLTFHFVVLARILFRAEDLSGAWSIFMGLWEVQWVLPRFAPQYLALVLIGYAIHFFVPEKLEKTTFGRFRQFSPITQAMIALTTAAVCWKVGTSEAIYFVYYKF